MATTVEEKKESDPNPTQLDDRRQFLTKALAAAGGTVMAGCDSRGARQATLSRCFTTVD